MNIDKNTMESVYCDFTPVKDYFALRVHDNSMINYGIKENTILICHKQRYADNGDIIVGLFNGVQVVRFYKELDNGNKFLLACNNDFLPIQITDLDEMLFVGKVVEFKNFI